MSGVEILGRYLSLYDYVEFCVSNLGFKPYPEQIEISDAIDNNSFVLALMARQAGKSYTVSSKLLQYALLRSGIRILIFAPKKDQAVDIIMGNIRNWISSNSFLKSLVSRNEQNVLVMSKDYVKFRNGSSIRCLGADIRSNIVGYTGDVIVCDERQSISDSVVNQYIMPMLGSIKDPKLIWLGTPRGKNGFFYAWQDGKRGGVWKVLEYPWQKCSNLNKKFVELQRRTNPHFASEYELKWQGNISSFFTSRELEDVFEDYDLSVFERMFSTGDGLSVYKERYAGIDWGFTNDRTVFSVFAREGSIIRLVGYKRFPAKTPVSKMIISIRELLDKYKPLVTYMDATQKISHAVSDNYTNLGHVVEDVVFSAKYKSSVLYPNFRHAVSSRVLRIPKIDEIVREMYDLEERRSSSYSHIEAPPGGHDDIPDSFALALLGFRAYIDECVGRSLLGDNYKDYSGLPDIFGIKHKSPFDYDDDKDSGRGVALI